jgi:hypothetical protein
MNLLDYIKDLFSCPERWMHSWKNSYWTIGDCGRGQSEGEWGYRCHHCGQIRYYRLERVNGKLIKRFYSLNELRDIVSTNIKSGV